MSNNLKVKGAAGINIELSEGVITVYHSECNSVLEKWTAKEGDWDFLWVTIELLKEKASEQ